MRRLIVAALFLVACKPSYEDVEARARAEEAAAKARASAEAAKRGAQPPPPPSPAPTATLTPAGMEMARRHFAEEYAALLRGRDLPMDDVAASGRAGTTLTVRGRYCGQAWINRFASDLTRDRAVTLGFVRVECIGPLDSAALDLL